ncbi:MAG: Gfo/Idh/MocA family oxidoreductase [Acidobacteria bacterium]|nr:Gfo/Idh/MocA family oxidoreductase [Acidobacteriota bacterium]
MSMTRRMLLSSTAPLLMGVPAPGDLLTPPEQAAGRRKKLRVGIVGCGRMGQFFAEVYRFSPDTELAAIAEYNDERRKVVGGRFAVKALFKEAPEMVRSEKLDIVAIITPTKFMKAAVLAAAEAGVRGISTDKPIAAKLADADAMVDACNRRKLVFAGGNLQRARWQTQIAAQRLRSGVYGKIIGATVMGYGGEISGGGCQHVAVLRLLTGAEITQVETYGYPAKTLAADASDQGLMINGRWRLSSGIDCMVFGEREPFSGVEVRAERATVRWSWYAPLLFEGSGKTAPRKEVDPAYPPFPWASMLDRPPLRKDDDYLVSSIRSFIDAVHLGRPSSSLFVSGHDLRQSLEAAIASKASAMEGGRPIALPLADRSLTLMPSPYRWLGGDAVGSPQAVKDASGETR